MTNSTEDTTLTLPARMDIQRTTRKKVKWGYRVRDGSDWTGWRPASSAAHLVAQIHAELPDDEGAQGLSANRLYNSMGRGARDGGRKASKRALPENIEIRKA